MRHLSVLAPLLLGACASPPDTPAPPAAHSAPTTTPAPPPGAGHLWVDRQGRRLYALDPGGAVALAAEVGIGAGGLREKASMADAVTPTGTFVVDIVLYEDPTFNAIGDDVRARLAAGDPGFAALLEAPDGLARLRATMDGLDFGGDGSPDHAYGVAYLGLDSPRGETGPKLRWRGEDLYWYSIALHGTPDPANIGAARSGGCVHVPEDVLRRLVTTGVVAVGTAVTIADSAPPGPQSSR